ncbi:MAG: hypothetical protein SNF68_03325 [Rikenellaceae bacterium]
MEKKRSFSPQLVVSQHGLSAVPSSIFRTFALIPEEPSSFSGTYHTF